MFKKTLALLFIAPLAFSLTACIPGISIGVNDDGVGVDVGNGAVNVGVNDDGVGVDVGNGAVNVGVNDDGVGVDVGGTSINVDGNTSVDCSNINGRVVVNDKVICENGHPVSEDN